MMKHAHLALLSLLALLWSVPALVAQDLPSGHPSMDAAPLSQEDHAARTAREANFLALVDLTPFARLAVHTNGRVKSFDTFAEGMMRFVTGTKHIDEQSHVQTYFDLMLRPHLYTNRPVIYVKKKVMRGEISRVLITAAEGTGRETEVAADMATFVEKGMISPSYLVNPAVRQLLTDLSTDLMKSAKFVNAINSALAVSNPSVLRRQMKIVPPAADGTGEAGATIDQPWFTPEELQGGMNPQLLQIDSAKRAGVLAAWHQFTSSWEASDANGVNAAAITLAEVLRSINTDTAVYPGTKRLELESWYFSSKNMTWVWIVYGFTLIPLLLFTVFRWEGARWAGLGLFMIAFGLQSAALGIRWYVAGYWPNSNMFEAITTAAWMGGAFAVIFELLARRSSLRGLVALGSAATSMVALMSVYYLPLDLNSQIGNRMPVLHDIWLYIHTNVIIFSYALIFMAAVSAVLYMLVRLVGMFRGQDGKSQFARVGGAASLIMTSPTGGAYLQRSKSSLGQVLDGTTMILMELSFVLLWAGIVMGAIWADHSWGRPWGWDPKEVFALNTFIVFIILVHGRLKMKDKGMWTAAVALIGCAVMIFNWVVINFTIAGLHSYA